MSTPITPDIQDIVISYRKIREQVNQTIPDTKIRSWFSASQEQIETLIQTVPENGILHATAIRGAQLNPLAPRQAFQASNWYRHTVSCTSREAHLLHAASAWLFDSKTVNETENTKISILKQRRKLIREAELTPQALALLVKHLNDTPKEIHPLHTEIVKNVLSKTGPLPCQDGKLRLLPVLKTEIRKHLGKTHPKKAKNTAYIKEHASGAATLKFFMTASAYAIFKTVTAPHIFEHIKENNYSSYSEQLAEAILKILKNDLNHNKTVLTPEKENKLSINQQKHTLGQLILVVSGEQYHRYITEDYYPVSTLNGVKIPSAEAREIAGNTPTEIVLLEGQDTILLGKPKENKNQRLASVYQRIALAARDPYCAYPGCKRPALSCQANHIIPWKQGGKTLTNNLVMVCPKHHAQVDDTHKLPNRGHFEKDKNGNPVWVYHPKDTGDPPKYEYNPYLLEHYEQQGWETLKLQIA